MADRQALQRQLRRRNGDLAQSPTDEEEDESVVQQGTTEPVSRDSLRDKLRQKREANPNQSASDEAAITDVPEIDESPEQYYLRTGEAPAGYRYVPSAPVSDIPEENVKLERISVPLSASEQTDKLFGYEKTAEAYELATSDIDLMKAIGSDKYIEENIPKPLQNFAKGVASLGDVPLRTLIVAAEAIGETTQDAGEAITRAVHETFTEDNKILGMTGKEILPFDPKTAGKKFAKDLSMMVEMAEAVPAVGAATGIAGATAQRAALKPLKEAKKSAEIVAKAEARKLRISKARAATADEIAEREARAAKTAAANRDISDELITQFEERTGKTVSDTVDGHKVLNPELARRAGVETAEEVSQANKGTVREFLTGDSNQTEAALLAGMGDDITQPLLKPEKLDALVATVADLKKKYPGAFDNDKTVIDNLFELTVNKELLAGDELIDMLNKYNISFEDYILTVVGSGSEAGKVLQKLSQIKRMRPTNEMIAMQEAATKNAAGAIRKTIMRVENIRRGGLVSQLATAARNLQSAAIRAPLEGFGNVMDNALYQLSEEGVGAGLKELGSFSNWKDSFRHMKYMFGPETRLDVKDYVDFLMEQPELAGQADLLFNNINEIQKLTGRGEGGAIDTTLTVLEDAVDVLNTPNRWQEHLIRRGAFLAELERLTKREYGIDLIDAINKGQIRDLLNDASSVRPKDARSFIDIMEEATNKALDITYAKQPEVPVFRSTSQFIVRNGLTVVLPFPRFMFNSMELMGQYAGGASIPLARKMMSIVTLGKKGGGKLTMKDRQRISRNIQGIAVAGAAYQYRTSEEAPSDYKLLKTGDDSVMDVTPQYPMRQFMYIGEAMKRAVDGTFDDWFKAKEFAETFIGTNIREGVGQSLIQEIADLATGVDLTNEEQAGRLLGRSLGNYLATWAVPFAQIIEAERATGIRGTQYKDTAEDPTLDFSSSFMNELSRPFRRFESAEAEAARPKREFLFAEEKSRVAPLFRVIGGINLATVDDEYGEYIGSFGYTDYELGSKSKVPSIRRFENTVVRDALPEIVESARIYEERLRNQYELASDKVKEEFTEDKFVSSRIRPFIKAQIQNVRKQISDGKTLSADAPEYAEAMLTYRRLPKEIRTAASVKFVEQYDRDPDGTDYKDLMRLVEIGKAYKSAYK